MTEEQAREHVRKGTATKTTASPTGWRIIREGQWINVTADEAYQLEQAREALVVRNVSRRR